MARSRGAALPSRNPRLTPRPGPRECSRFTKLSTMGKQYNKGIKKKRRVAYLKRKKAAAKTAKKPAKAKK